MILDAHPIQDGRIERHIKFTVEDCPVVRLNLTRNQDNHLMEFSEWGERGLFYNINSHTRIAGGPLLGKILRVINYTQVSRDLVSFLESAGIRADKDSIIHVHDSNLLIYALSIKKNFIPHSKIVYDRHEIWENWDNASGIIVRVNEVVFNFMIDGVVTVLDSHVNKCRKMFKSNDIVSVPNYSMFSDYDSKAIQSKIDDITNNSPLLFSYVGSLFQNIDRDIKLLLELCEMALDLDESVTVKIGGFTDDQNIICEFSRLREKFDCRFQYLGRIPRKEVVKICEESHVGFLLLLENGRNWGKVSPNKLYEYLMTGTIPVVRAHLEDSEEFSCYSLLFGRNDSKEHIIQSFLELITDRNQMKQMMMQGLSNRSKFSFENVGKRYSELYKELLK